MLPGKYIQILLVTLLLFTALSCSLKKEIIPDDPVAKYTIRESINNYSSDDWEIRLNAIQRASKYGNSIYAKNVILLMLLAADDYHPLVRIEALRCLKIIKAESALDKIREIAMDDSDRNVRRAAISALQDYALEANAGIFISGIESNDWLIREESYIGLIKIDPDDIQKKFLNLLINGIKDRNISVQIAILNNITIKDPLLYHEISGLINNRDTKASLLRGALVAVKGYTFDEKTRSRLFELLTHRNRDIRVLSLQALKREKIEMNY
ncbi:MAG TPA: HEAT repeat domain-containing protein [Spirochaetota bacterium]|nr:HEAT repeat domain-containing protein [Spirochaetota bacterium]HPJ33339.1 HEAT repeat domain-containing protein [Spirochaetota bacterium]